MGAYWMPSGHQQASCEEGELLCGQGRTLARFAAQMYLEMVAGHGDGSSIKKLILEYMERHGPTLRPIRPDGDQGRRTVARLTGVPSAFGSTLRQLLRFRVRVLFQEAQCFARQLIQVLIAARDLTHQLLAHSGRPEALNVIGNSEDGSLTLSTTPEEIADVVGHVHKML
jgi:hypothetical protein